MPLLIDIREKNQTHQLKIIEANDQRTKNQLYQYRYHAYLKYNLISENSNQMDYDEYDEKSCHHIYATYDNVIVGHLRMITGNCIPTLDKYYHFDHLPDVINQCPHDRIVEVGRIISTPYEITTFIPRHFVILALFYYCFQLSKDLHMKLVVGALKKRVADKLERIKFPIELMDSYQLNYDPKEHNDPLINFFNEELTGEICPVYLTEQNAENFFSSLYQNHLLFAEIENEHVALNNLYLFNLFLMLNKIKHTKPVSLFFR